MAFTPIIVTGTYMLADGSPAAGTVGFTPSNAMWQVAGDIVPVVERVATLDGTGRISIIIDACDDPSTLPVGTSYVVTESIEGANVRIYNVLISHGAFGGTVDLSTLTPLFAVDELSFVVAASVVEGAQGPQGVPGSSGSVTKAAVIATGLAPSDIGGADKDTSGPNSGYLKQSELPLPIVVLNPSSATAQGQFLPSLIGSGTFFARRTTVRLHTDIGMNTFGGGKWGIVLAVGLNGALPTTWLIGGQWQSGAGGVIAAPSTVLVWPVPNMSFQPGAESMHCVLNVEGLQSSSGDLTLSGLTIGAEYTVQLFAYTLSGLGTSPLPSGTARMCAAPDNRTVWVCTATNTIIPVTVGFKPLWSLGCYQDLTSPPAGQTPALQYTGSAVSLPGGAISTDICTAPPGTSNYGIVTNYSADTATVFNWVTQAVVGTTGTMGATAIGCCIEPTGTTAYVSTDAGIVKPVTLSTQSVGAGLTLAAGHVLDGMAISHDGLRLWVADITGIQIIPVVLSGLTVGTPVAMGTGNTPSRVYASPDDTMWVTAGNLIKQFNQTGTVLQTYDPAVANGFGTGTYGPIRELLVNTAGTAVFWFTDTTAGCFRTSDLSQWYAPGAFSLTGSACMSTDGYEYIYFGTSSSLDAFLCGEATFGSAGDFGYVVTTVEGATLT